MELVQQKMALLADEHYLDLARVAMAETIHSPERAQAMVARMDEKESSLSHWIRAAQKDGRVKQADMHDVSHLLLAPLKTFAFWPQIILGKPMLTAARRQEVMDIAVDMFLCYYSVTPQPA